HEEVMKIEDQLARDVLIYFLLERQLNVQPDSLASRHRSSAICGFHHAARAPRAHDEVMMTGQPLGPFGDSARKLHRVVVVASEFDLLLSVRELCLHLFREFVVGSNSSFHQLQLCRRLFRRDGTRRSEEDDCVSNAMLAKPRRGLDVLRHYPESPCFGTLQEFGIEVWERRNVWWSRS